MVTIHTIGHSTRSLEELLSLLHDAGIALLTDVRRFPGSRRHPQFSRQVMASALESANVGYVHEEGLGGRRSVQPGSLNGGWRNRAFRGYADYMDTPDFRAALQRLIDRARETSTAIMCAEAVPWRCHRNLIADALFVRGIDVMHILGPGKVDAHSLSAHARVLPDGRLIYPGREGQPDLFE